MSTLDAAGNNNPICEAIDAAEEVRDPATSAEQGEKPRAGRELQSRSNGRSAPRLACWRQRSL